MKLYEIDSALDALIETIANAGGEVTPEQEQQWDDLLASKDNKLANIARLLRNKTVEMEALQGEIERLERRYDANERTVEWLKRYVEHSLGEGRQWTDGIFSFSWGKTEIVEVDKPVDELPESFVKIIPEQARPDKLAMKAFLKVNKLTEGDGFHLREKKYLKLS